MGNNRSGVFKFKYTELVDKNEITNTLVIETKDVVRSIGRFGESRNLVDSNVKQLGIKYNK